MFFFLVETPAYEIVEKNNKNEMSKTFFIFFSIPKDLFFGEPNIYHDLGVFYKNVGRLWRLSDCEELVGVTWRESDLWRISGG